MEQDVTAIKCIVSTNKPVVRRLLKITTKEGGCEKSKFKISRSNVGIGLGSWGASVHGMF